LLNENPGRVETPQYSLNAVFEAVGGKGVYIMDKRGEGVPTIFSEREELSGEKPEYCVIDDTELQLTIFAAEVQ
jgi:predicted HTH transcriptional regulator